MSAVIDKNAFSYRLFCAVREAGVVQDINKNAVIARHLSNEFLATTPEDVKSWFAGRDLPDPMRMQALATWLNTTSDALAYGVRTQQVGTATPSDASDAEREAAAKVWEQVAILLETGTPAEVVARMSRESAAQLRAAKITTPTV